MGTSVSGAGDVNGDGFADLIVGAPNYGVGNSYVVFGRTDTAAVDLSPLAPNSGGFIITGVSPGDRGGNSVSAAGDVNGDGLADLIVGASGIDSSYVVFGKADAAGINLSAVEAGTGGFAIHGEADGCGRYGFARFRH